MQPADTAQLRSRSNGLCACLLLVLALCSLVPADAPAADQSKGFAVRGNTDAQKSALARIAAPSFPAPFAFSAPRAEMPAFSPTEFRTRKQGLPEAATAGGAVSPAQCGAAVGHVKALCP
ncbi:MAG: hypothetical protein ABI145_07190 [Steroidobacteraceae bacterium]